MYPVILAKNGNKTIKDLFKLLKDIIFIDPSENTIKINPKMKTKLLNLID